MDTDGGGAYLWVTIDEQAAPRRVVARGDLDAGSAGALAEQLDRAATGAADVALDLGEVRFIDSSGLRSLIEVARRSEAEGFAFRVVAASEPVRRVFDLTGTSFLLGP